MKRHLGVFAAGRTLDGKHLPWARAKAIAVAVVTTAEAAAAVLLCFPCVPARGTTLRLVSVAFDSEVLLFLNSKGKAIAAIGTCERFVLISHRITSLFRFG